MRRLSSHGSAYVPIIITAALVIVIGIGGLLFLNRSDNTVSTTTKQTSLSSYCVGQSFTTGSSGHCVRDIQTLINYMEHSGLTECSFLSGATLPVSGTYDSATARQVLAVQHWASCYAQQEGFSPNIKQSGTVDKTTWGELCTYGYTDPLHTSAKGANGSIAAGKDAGCGSLRI